MLSFVAMLTVVAPWIAGASIMLKLCPLGKHRAAGMFISCGIGGTLGLIAIATLVLIADAIGADLASAGSLLLMMLIGFAAAVHLVATLIQEQSWGRRDFLLRPADIAIILICLCALSFLFFHSISNPAFAWDTVTHWTEAAEPLLSLNEHASHSEARHFLTVPALLAWPTIVNNFFGVTFANIHLWFFLQLSITLTAVGTAFVFGQSVFVAALAAYLTLTLPLLENHVIGFGYSELLAGGLLFTGTSALMMGLYLRNRLLIACAFMLLLALVFARNTGIVYASLPICSLILLSLFQKFGRHFWLTLLASASIMALVGSTTTLGLQFLNWLTHIANDYFFAANRAKLAPIPIFQALEIELRSKIVNSSFSISLLMALLGLAQTCRLKACRPLQLILALPSVIVLLGLALLVASLYTNYGLRFADVGQDTGHSRFSIPLFIMSPLVFLTLAINTDRAERFTGSRLDQYLQHRNL